MRARGSPATGSGMTQPPRFWGETERMPAEPGTLDQVTRVLVVDDEPQILRALRINLRVRSYQVDTAATGAQALEAAALNPDVPVFKVGVLQT